MSSLIEAFIEFIRVRQINFAVAALLTCGYMVYQYWGMLFKVRTEELEDCPHSMHKLDPRSRSRSRSRSSYREKIEMKHGRVRRAYGRCPDCSKCNLDNTK